MKALRYYANKDLRYVDVPEPSPGQGQVKIKVSYAGICGSDLREYMHGPFAVRGLKTYGHEYGGTVVELGRGVTGWKIGDRIAGMGFWVCGECHYCKNAQMNLCSHKPGVVGGSVDGCMADYLVAPTNSLVKLPDSVSDEFGAVVEPLAVGLHNCKQANIHPGDIVAIVGDGPIGLCTLLSAKAIGAAEIYVISKHKKRGEVALAMGATKVVYLDENPVEKIREMTGGLGANSTIDCGGSIDSPLLSIELTRAGGSVVIAAVGGNVPTPIYLRPIFGGEKQIVGSNSNTIQEFTTVVALLANKSIDASRLITAKIPLKDAVEKGFKVLLDNKDSNIKVLLKP